MTTLVRRRPRGPLPFAQALHIIFDMSRRYRLPSVSALTAFEAAARRASFSRAAEELATSQSAISRHVAELEARLGTKLFERRHNRLRLTSAGALYARAVATSLEDVGRRRTRPDLVGGRRACDHRLHL